MKKMLTILIVDDEKLERNGIKFLLKREQEEFNILEAGNGKDALGVLATHHVDILFSDVKMPYMNGLELARQVKEMYPDMELVIFSGYNDFSYAREALRYGVVDYVLKPVDPDEFKKTLDRVRKNICVRMEEKQKQDSADGRSHCCGRTFQTRMADHRVVQHRNAAVHEHVRQDNRHQCPVVIIQQKIDPPFRRRRIVFVRHHLGPAKRKQRHFAAGKKSRSANQHHQQNDFQRKQ